MFRSEEGSQQAAAAGSSFSRLTDAAAASPARVQKVIFEKPAKKYFQRQKLFSLLFSQNSCHFSRLFLLSWEPDSYFPTFL